MCHEPVLERRVIHIEFTIREDDGLAWVNGDTIVINARWLTNHPPNVNEVIDEINRSVLHEILEHYHGLGHECALAAESLVYGSKSSKSYFDGST